MLGRAQSTTMLRGTRGQAEPADLRRRVTEVDWYHTFDLPGGVTTQGLFDHRSVVGRLPIPLSLAGQRCLDVASSDGFFAFELARRGAAEVVSVDLPDHGAQDFGGPPRPDAGRSLHSGRANRCFRIVADATGLDVRRVDGSVYALDRLGLGQFDFVFMGNILLHLRDPILALQKVRAVTAGELLSFEAISLPQTVLRPLTPTAQFAVDDDNRFWTPNKAGHARLLEAGGFTVEATGGPLFQPLGAGWPRVPTLRNRPRSLSEILFWVFTRNFGAASAWARATRA
jgi:tRNA (mo5U34)-methyltransferase